MPDASSAFNGNSGRFSPPFSGLKRPPTDQVFALVAEVTTEFLVLAAAIAGLAFSFFGFFSSRPRLFMPLAIADLPIR